MKKMKSVAGLSLIMASSLFVTGCATNIRQPQSEPQPSTERFGTFDSVYYENVTIAPDFADATPNQRAANRINEEVIEGLNDVFSNMQVVDNAPESVDGKALVIRPKIVEIKFIGGAVRFWVGAMAGSSAVYMQVEYVDLQSGNVVANPEFYRAGSAHTGGMSMGATDNVMLTMIAQDIISYTSRNR